MSAQSGIALACHCNICRASSRAADLAHLAQGLVLDCGPLPWVPLDSFPAPEARSSTLRLPVWLALDEVTDPVWAPGCQSLILTPGRPCCPLRAASSSPLLGSLCWGPF